VLGRLLLAALVGIAGWFVALQVAPGQSAGASTLTGVDVSRWDHPGGAAIDWPKVKTSGRSFAIVKATEGTTYVNPYFSTDYPQAKAAGLVVGAYHFAQPRLPISSAADQARHYVRTVGTFKGTGLLPPVLDLECDGGGSPCTYGTDLTPSQLQQWTKLWLDTAQEMTGRVPIIYTYDSFWRNAMGNTTAFTKYPLWYARYTTTTPTAATLPGGWTRWTMWQYTSTGTTPGIPDTGDINRFNGDLASLRALADGSRALGVPGPVQAPRTALSGERWAKVVWDPPATNGGAPVLDYTVSVDGGPAQTTPSRAFVVVGTATGARTLQIRARTVAGEGAVAPLTVTVPATGAAPPDGATRLSLSVPSTASATSSFLASARLTRIDTGQSIGGAPLSWRRVPEKGPEPSLLPLTTGADGSVSTSMKFSIDVWTKLSYGGSYGASSVSASRSVRVTPWLSASLSATSVPRRSTVTLTGRTTYLLAGEKALRQQLIGGTWRTISSRPVAADGTVRFSVYASSKGTRSLRIVLPSTSLHATKVSSTVVLRVR
jgi:GH25 family lysozyme M1 (1,4-beta-N-acetylmuramidase)